MNREEIKKILPHREPMLLVDEAFLLEDGTATGTYTVRGDEFFLQGHFPGNPIVPGVILCEMMIQSSCVLFLDKVQTGKTPMYTGMDGVKFRQQVKPGDTIIFKTKILRSKMIFYVVEGEGFVNGKLAVKGELSFALA